MKNWAAIEIIRAFETYEEGIDVRAYREVFFKCVIMMLTSGKA